MGLSAQVLRNIESSNQEILDIEYADMSNVSVVRKLVKALNKNGNFKTLRLFHCFINDAGAAELAKAEYLTELDLSENNIGLQGAQLLIGNKRILHLNLSSNPIEIEKAKAFTQNHTLQTLILNKNDLISASNPDKKQSLETTEVDTALPLLLSQPQAKKTGSIPVSFPNLSSTPIGNDSEETDLVLYSGMIQQTIEKIFDDSLDNSKLEPACFPVLITPLLNVYNKRGRINEEIVDKPSDKKILKLSFGSN